MSAALPDFRLEIYLRALGVRGQPPPDGLGRADADDRRAARAGHGRAARGVRRSSALAYAPTWGSPGAARGDRRHLRRASTAEHVLAFAGAEEAMFWALQELVGPGDHAVVTVPNYQSMETLTLRTGAEVDGLVLAPEDGWALDLDALAALLRPETTARRGQLPQQPDRRACPTARRSARWPSCATSAASGCSATRSTAASSSTRRARCRRPPTCRERALSLNVMSKAYGLPGLRIGWLGLPRPRAARAPRAAQALHVDLQRRRRARSWPRSRCGTAERIRARNRAIIARNLPRLRRVLRPLARALRVGAAAGRLRLLPALPRRRRGEPLLPRARREGGRGLLPGRHLRVRAGAVPARPLPHRRRPPRPGPALAAFEAFLAGRY